jgi:hypothetical protein
MHKDCPLCEGCGYVDEKECRCLKVKVWTWRET